jgi:hypothetical protein
MKISFFDNIFYWVVISAQEREDRKREAEELYRNYFLVGSGVAVAIQQYVFSIIDFAYIK